MKLAKIHEVYQQRCSGLAPIGESLESILAQALWTFANHKSPIGDSLIGESLIGESLIGESLIGESLIGEVPESR
ncbi:unnamed protein product, partial [Rotaria magnacalcarata]